MVPPQARTAVLAAVHSTAPAPCESADKEGSFQKVESESDSEDHMKDDDQPDNDQPASDYMQADESDDEKGRELMGPMAGTFPIKCIRRTIKGPRRFAENKSREA